MRYGPVATPLFLSPHDKNSKKFIEIDEKRLRKNGLV
jgi:hypothetical protein